MFVASFGAKLRYLRQQRGLTQVELAGALNLASHSHISYLEADTKHPSLPLAHQIACLFEVTIDYLLLNTVDVDDVRGWPSADNGTAMQRFGAKLRMLRKHQHLTQSELALQLGLKSHTHISELEKNIKDPSRDLLLAISYFFNVPTDILIRDGVELPE